MIKLQTNVDLTVKSRLEIILERLGLSEAEYLRGALLARMRRDTRVINREIREGIE